MLETKVELKCPTISSSGAICTGDFDCEASVAYLQSVLPDTVECDTDYQASQTPWADCNGDRAAETNIQPLVATVGGVEYPMQFNPPTGAAGPTNDYTINIPTGAIGNSVTFKWGLPANPDDLCDLTLPFEPCVIQAKSFKQVTFDTSPSNSQITLHGYATDTVWGANNQFYLPRYDDAVYKANPDGTCDLVHQDLGFANSTSDYCNAFLDINDPDKMWGFTGGSLVTIDMNNPAVQTNFFTAPAGSGKLVMGGAGSLNSQGSTDDAQSTVLLNNNDFIFVIDLNTGALLQQIPRPAGYNWGSVSKSGLCFAVVTGGAQGGVNLTTIYSTATGQIKATSADVNHSDWVIDANGVEYLSFVGNPPKLLSTTGVTTTHGNSAFWGTVSGEGPSGKHYFSWNAGISGGTVDRIGCLDVGDDIENIELCDLSGLPQNDPGNIVVNRFQLNVSPSGQYGVITVTENGVPNTWLIQFF